MFGAQIHISYIAAFLVGILTVVIPAYVGGATITSNSTISGLLSVTGALTKGSGSFVIDHPLDPENKLLFHSFLESPDVKNIYDGIANSTKMVR